ncbi:uncharacterized protein BDW47DRAFT_134537 [Aspergillus candidus]|uniref:Arylsulfotransferase ASST n=1 Tax=Aspergillus candidus TaxID=41067 RepID=A0A2I2FJ97_ASPCN|nr:hypothetical protein BDW47DRAFT_134537 [Aspergillus candidus]PLB40692.1 hypothetical protein BDW47DRAFT_134537 [Aspergillus candidus]
MEQNTLARRGLGLRGLDTEKLSPGYVLYTPLTSSTTHLISSATGEEVHRWTLPYRAGRHARLLPDGNTLAYNGAHPAPPDQPSFPMWSKYRGGVMAHVSPDGTILREYRDPLAHHDQLHSDDGRTILYTTMEPLTPAEAARVRGGVPGSEADSNSTIYGDCIRLVLPWESSNRSSSDDFKPGGGGTGGAKLLWEWRAADHLDPAEYPLLPHYARDHWPFINGLAVDGDGNIVASLRSASKVIVINRDTGAVVWSVGQPAVNQQHCPVVLPSSGNLMVFDNGVFRPGKSKPFSKGVIVSRETKEVIWEWMDASTGGVGFLSPFMGSAMPVKGSSNVLLCEGAMGRILEVTRDGRVVWEFVVPQLRDYRGLMEEREVLRMEKIGSMYKSNGIFRAYKYRPEEIPWLKK